MEYKELFYVNEKPVVFAVEGNLEEAYRLIKENKATIKCETKDETVKCYIASPEGKEVFTIKFEKVPEEAYKKLEKRFETFSKLIEEYFKLREELIKKELELAERHMETIFKDLIRAFEEALR